MTLVGHASSTRGARRRYIRVSVHDTVADLQDAANRYAGSDMQGAAACFHPATHRERHVDGRWQPVLDSYAGTMRLARDHLGVEVLAHECTHAALAIYRQDVAGDVDLGTDCEEAEETVAYYVGDLTAQVTNVLYDLGVW